jgi:hypothetical protein
MSSSSTRNDLYHLTRTLQHALQAAEAAEQFGNDTETHNPQLLAFFDEVRRVNIRLAEAAREHLREHLARQDAPEPRARPLHPLSSEEKVDEAIEETFPASDPPAAY